MYSIRHRNGARRVRLLKKTHDTSPALPRAFAKARYLFPPAVLERTRLSSRPLLHSPSFSCVRRESIPGPTRSTTAVDACSVVSVQIHTASLDFPLVPVAHLAVPRPQLHRPGANSTWSRSWFSDSDFLLTKPEGESCLPPVNHHGGCYRASRGPGWPP